MKTKLYRQGDVMIRRVNRIPNEAVAQPASNGLVILAHGEVTGHHHSFATDDVEEFKSAEGEQFFRVKGRTVAGTFPIIRRWRNQVMIKHPELGLIEFNTEDVEVECETARVGGKFGLLKHQEHTVQAIPAGDYAGGSAGKSVRQREYTPQAIRNVAD